MQGLTCAVPCDSLLLKRLRRVGSNERQNIQDNLYIFKAKINVVGDDYRWWGREQTTHPHVAKTATKTMPGRGVLAETLWPVAVVKATGWRKWKDTSASAGERERKRARKERPIEPSACAESARATEANAKHRSQLMPTKARPVLVAFAQRGCSTVAPRTYAQRGRWTRTDRVLVFARLEKT